MHTPKEKKMNMASKMGGAVKGAVKKVGNFLDKHYLEPTRRVNRIQNAKMQQMDADAKAGLFN